MTFLRFLFERRSSSHRRIMFFGTTVEKAEKRELQPEPRSFETSFTKFSTKDLILTDNLLDAIKTAYDKAGRANKNPAIVSILVQPKTTSTEESASADKIIAWAGEVLETGIHIDADLLRFYLADREKYLEGIISKFKQSVPALKTVPADVLVRKIDSFCIALFSYLFARDIEDIKKQLEIINSAGEAASEQELENKARLYRALYRLQKDEWYDKISSSAREHTKLAAEIKNIAALLSRGEKKPGSYVYRNPIGSSGANKIVNVVEILDNLYDPEKDRTLLVFKALDGSIPPEFLEQAKGAAIALGADSKYKGSYIIMPNGKQIWLIEQCHSTL